jgi:hypothetical protein
MLALRGYVGSSGLIWLFVTFLTLGVLNAPWSCNRGWLAPLKRQQVLYLRSTLSSHAHASCQVREQVCPVPARR